MPQVMLKQTALYPLHIAQAARMVAFAGYEMPLQYPLGIIAEHLHTRALAGLFDVSHMGQIKITGAGVAEALERLVPTDVVGLPVKRLQYSVLTTEQGGVLDDLIIANCGDNYRLIVNAAGKTADLKHLRQWLSTLRIEELDSESLLALQGPSAEQVLREFFPGVAKLDFMSCDYFDYQGQSCWISRSGYTGEDGFEIALPNAIAVDFAQQLAAHTGVAWVGLGARDTLRLEAGLCLYGHDLDPITSPVEAGLGWLLPATRQPLGPRPGQFPGAEIIFTQLLHGVQRRRVGLKPQGKLPIRDNTPLLNQALEVVGTVTSGSFSPTLGVPIAMAYVATAYQAPGTLLQAQVRSSTVPVEVVKLPFIPLKYKRHIKEIR